MKNNIVVLMELLLCFVSCSSESTELDRALLDYCFEGKVAKELTDGRLCVRIDEVSNECLSDLSFCFVAFKKTDMPNKEYKKGDVISFKIKKYEKAYDDSEDLTFPDWGIFVRYNCIVEPCN